MRRESSQPQNIAVKPWKETQGQSQGVRLNQGNNTEERVSIGIKGSNVV